jgi:hypothetical protein
MKIRNINREHVTSSEVVLPSTKRYFAENGFTIVSYGQLVDAVYAANFLHREFSAFKISQHLTTLPPRHD